MQLYFANSAIMETILENIIELIEKIWLRLDIFLGLEDFRVLNFIHPLLTGILSDPLLLGLTVASIVFIVYITYKIKKSYNEKEKRLDALLQELDETEANDAIDFDEPLLVGRSLEASDFDKTGTKPPQDLTEAPSNSEVYGDEFESPSSEKQKIVPELGKAPQEAIANDFKWDSTPEEWGKLYDNVSEELQETDSISEVSQKSEQEISKVEESDQAPQEITDNDFNWNSTIEEWDELYDNISEELQDTDSISEVSQKSEQEISTVEESDQAPQEITDNDFNWNSTIEEWDELYDNVSEGLQETSGLATAPSKEKEFEEGAGKLEEATQELEETEEFLEAVSNLNKEPAEIAPEEELEETEEFLEAVSNLNKEPTEIAPEEELEETEEFLEAVSNLNKEPAEIAPEEELEETEEFLEAVSNLNKEPTEIAPEEELEETEEFLEAVSNLNKEPTGIVPERIELSLEEIELEPALELGIAPDTQAPESSDSPLLKSMLNSSVSAKTDALVSRLKSFQSELETRFNSLEIQSEESEATTGEILRKKQNKYQPAKINYISKRKSRSNKEYLSQLESFIFMAKQKH